MMTAIEKLAKASSAANVKRTDALGAIQLVAGNRKQIDLQLIDVDGNFSGRLHGVGVEVDVGFFGDAADLLERLDGAEFVVGVHDGDEHGFRTKSPPQMFKVN